MSELSREQFELSQLILESLEGDIPRDRFNQLEKQINEDPAAAQQYLDQVMNHAVLMWRCESLHAEAGLSESPEDTRFLSAMGEYEKTAPAVEKEMPESIPSAPPTVIRSAETVRRINKFSLAAALTLMAALVMLLVYIEMHPADSIEPAARILDSVGAVWAEAQNGRLEPEDQIYPHAGPLELKEGYAKIRFEYGTEVVLEGPARFEVTGPEEMSVDRGQLYARSPSSAIGFTISSPHLKIIDLGTEFGVRVAGDGTADVHMIQGKASLIAGQEGSTQSSEIIHGGQARRVDLQETMKDIRLEEDLFARQISSKTGLIWRGEDLNLADLVGGGNGLGGGSIGKGIHLVTGQSIAAANDTIQLRLDSGYRNAAASPLIDGVFVPDRNPDGEPVISSVGHRFEMCPDTSGRGLSGIYNGRVFAGSAHEYYSMSLQDGSAAVPSEPAICLYGNAGITFDLEAVRAAIPRCRIRAFHAICGLSPYSAVHNLPAGNSQADLFVLVDGKMVFESRAVCRFSEPSTLSIPIGPTDRFLTLVGTDGGESLGMDWVVFAEPCLELTLE